MRVYLYFYIIFFLFLFNSCQTDTPNNPPKTNPSTFESIKVKVNKDKMRIRKSPDVEADIIGEVSLGTIFSYAGTMTDFSTKIQLGGVWYEEPWIAVKRENENDTVWIYGGGIEFEGEDSEELAEILLQQRLKAFFEELSPNILSYRENYASASTVDDFVKVFREGDSLKYKVIQKLEQKIPIDLTEQMPDVFWVEEMIPGYVVELVAEGTKYYLFKDYKQLYTKARQTEGEEDDIFTDLGLEIYSRDSIEYFFASWFMQTWDYGGHSLLGSGKHNDVLALADEVMSMTSLFENEIKKIKADIINDISHPEITYWNDQEPILKELNEIMDAQYDILSKEDKATIESRIKQFKDADKNKIEVNLRSGMEG